MPPHPKPKFFKTPFELRKWFLKNQSKGNELWIGFYKKSCSKKAVSYAEALDQALCFGWIDGIRRKVDEESYTNRFTPRRKKSNWSKINKSHVVHGGPARPPGPGFGIDWAGMGGIVPNRRINFVLSLGGPIRIPL